MKRLLTKMHCNRFENKHRNEILDKTITKIIKTETRIDNFRTIFCTYTNKEFVRYYPEIFWLQQIDKICTWFLCTSHNFDTSIGSIQTCVQLLWTTGHSNGTAKNLQFVWYLFPTLLHAWYGCSARPNLLSYVLFSNGDSLRKVVCLHSLHRLKIIEDHYVMISRKWTFTLHVYYLLTACVYSHYANWPVMIMQSSAENSTLHSMLIIIWWHVCTHSLLRAIISVTGTLHSIPATTITRPCQIELFRSGPVRFRYRNWLQTTAGCF